MKNSIAKKLALLITCSLLATALVGCTNDTTSSDSSNSSTSSSQEASSNDTSSNDTSSSIISDDTDTENHKITVADAAMYRGTVTLIEGKQDGKTITLERAPGTNFGAQTVTFVMNKDTKTSFAADMLVLGSYLEVFYSAPEGTKLDTTKQYIAIAANIYDSAELVNFNGIVQSVRIDVDKTSGQIVLTGLDNEQETAFNFGSQTHMYLTLADLKPGDKLNILHKGIFTRSIPPQGIATEIRIYFEGDNQLYQK